MTSRAFDFKQTNIPWISVSNNEHGISPGIERNGRKVGNKGLQVSTDYNKAESRKPFHTFKLSVAKPIRFNLKQIQPEVRAIWTQNIYKTRKKQESIRVFEWQKHILDLPLNSYTIFDTDIIVALIMCGEPAIPAATNSRNEVILSRKQNKNDRDKINNRNGHTKRGGIRIGSNNVYSLPSKVAAWDN